jgi:subtilisin family serine protease
LRKFSLLLAVFLFLNQTAFAVQTENSVKIAIIDTGISTKALGSAQIAQGKNYILPNQDTEDKINHGTAVASLIVGKPDRELVGAYPEANLVPLVYYSLEEKSVVKGDATMLAQCIYDAVDVFSCRVINLSAGILIDSKELKDACEYAEKKGVVIVSAVGNDHQVAPQNLYYPAAYDTVIGVGALNKSGKVAGFSQRNTSVSLVTSGEDLWVARASGRMTHVNGTSYASAFVSAAAARLLAENPDLSPSDVRSILYEAATDLGEVGYDIESGYGALNILKALELAKDYHWIADVPRNSWYFDAVKRIYRLGTLNPKGNATRTEVVTMILNYLNSIKQ